MSLFNLITMVDGYKPSHPEQYPPGTDYVFDYYESRGGSHKKVCPAGMQMFIKEHLLTPITHKEVDFAAKYFPKYGAPFPEAGWRRVVDKHSGFAPVRIRAVPEGEVVSSHNVLMTTETLDPELPWINGWMETQLMRPNWYGTGVSSKSRNCKEKIFARLVQTADDPQGEILWKLHDFGGRGVSSDASARYGGMAHLVHSSGSDTVEGAIAFDHYYGKLTEDFVPDQLCAGTIPAAEHRTVTAWGRDGQLDFIRMMIRKYGSGVFAVVSDTYDLFDLVRNGLGKALKSEILLMPGVLVVRPDSGSPPEMVRGVLRDLREIYGTVKNTKGYQVLNKTRVIQGDGIKNESDDDETIEEILDTSVKEGFSTTNIFMGMGGGLLQEVNRDTQKMACKASLIRVNGQYREIYKDPVTDPGKASRGGKLDLIRGVNGQFETVAIPPGLAQASDSQLITFYETGKCLVDQTVSEIRKRAWSEYL